jgi:hypothetical protein
MSEMLRGMMQQGTSKIGKVITLAGYGLFALTLALIATVPAMAGYPKNPDLYPVSINYKVDQEHKLSLQYNVYAGGFEALNAKLVMDLDKRAYDMKLQAKTEGFIGALFPWSASYNTSGHAEKGRLLPTVYTERSTWRGNEKVTEMDYGPNGKVLKSTTQDGNNTTVDRDINQVLSANTLDLLTGTLVMLQSAKNTKKCTGKFPVFDGKRRFNIVLKDDGTEDIAPSRYSKFSGEAMRCTLTVEPVAGFEPKDQKRGWMAVQNHTEAHHMLPTIWLARVGDSGQVVPVRMEIASEYGAVVAHLSGGTDD